MLLPRSIRKLTATLSPASSAASSAALAALVLLGCAGNAATPTPEVAVDPFWLTEEIAFFWAFIPPGEQDVRLYLLGSVHILDVPLALGPKLERAFSAADVLAMEVDREFGEEELMEQMIRYGILEWGESLEHFVSPETIAELHEYLESRDASPDEVEFMTKLRPWAIAMIIEQQALESLGFKSEYGVEEYFLARDEAMPVVGLETPDEVFYDLSSNSDALQEAILISAINGATREAIDHVLAAWKDGDTALLKQQLASEDEAFPGYYESFLYGRNERMASGLIELIEENPGPVYFAVVGAAHVIGESNIPSLLEAEGFVATDTSAPLVSP